MPDVPREKEQIAASSDTRNDLEYSGYLEQEVVWKLVKIWWIEAASELWGDKEVENVLHDMIVAALEDPEAKKYHDDSEHQETDARTLTKKRPGGGSKDLQQASHQNYCHRACGYRMKTPGRVVDVSPVTVMD